MAGLEVVVRPVVFPNIRPAPARSLPPQDDPEKGFAVIKGNGAKLISLSNSYSSSASTSNRTEIQRRGDTARVYQKNDDGTVNRENFVDIDVPNKIWMEGPPGDAGTAVDDPTAPTPTRSSMNRVEIDYYRPVQEALNIEVKKRDWVKRSGEEFSE